MTAFSKPLCIFITIFLIVLLFALSVYITQRIGMSSHGVCIAENRVLSNEEHRQAFLRNLVYHEINNSNIHNRMFGTQALQTGIIRDTPQLDIRRLVEGFYNNGKSFEENFSIEVIAPGDHGFDITKLDEPFFLITYRADRDGSSTFISSSSVIEIDYSQEVRERYRPSLYERYRGFGNKYYKITYTFISRECCDNKLHRRSREEYMARKLRAYNNTLSSFNRGFATHTNIAIASNCGKILTEDSDTGKNTRVIQWILGVGD